MVTQIYSKEEIQTRRDIIMSFMARGVVSPAKILQIEGIPSLYEKYKKPYHEVVRDITAIKKALTKRAEIERIRDEATLLYIIELEEGIRQLWEKLEELEGTSLVNAFKTLSDLYTKKAIASGVTMETLTLKHSGKIENEHNGNVNVTNLITDPDFITAKREAMDNYYYKKREKQGN
ncbi:hypothetical protein [Methanobacterium formicicum]|uniref:Uncharacterized protein n=1 Tax=Methanobacterium formicicum (strain DSM 3637 / PP1) TaxID=1204725 RepID=K2R2W7_METFP|nr:hypothetical protein [Methanobacterium formicicum]EKF86848.1 hypothetical protein A994_01140 [Methanobacterium formicicum DSM 3637]